MNKIRRYIRNGLAYFRFLFLKGDMLPAAKHLFIKWTAKKYGCGIFIETGTAYGDTVEAVRKSFKRVYSIELKKELYFHSIKRFENYKKVVILFGDSPEILKNILQYIDEPCLLWLDAHWSGGVTGRGKVDDPAIDELKAISKSNLDHVILIDDCMYLLGSIKEQAAKMGYNVKIIRNIIRLKRDSR